MTGAIATSCAWFGSAPLFDRFRKLIRGPDWQAVDEGEYQLSSRQHLLPGGPRGAGVLLQITRRFTDNHSVQIAWLRSVVLDLDMALSAVGVLTDLNLQAVWFVGECFGEGQNRGHG